MKLSIITVCFNAENTIEKTIKSILEQTSTEFEWVVVDGKSTDTTNEIIKKYLPEFECKGVKVNYCSENDKGIYDAMNKGAQRATGEYLTYMNADDLYYKNDSICCLPYCCVIVIFYCTAIRATVRELIGRETVVAGIAVIVVHLISPRYSSWSLSENHCGVQEELAADILLPRGCSA